MSKKPKGLKPDEVTAKIVENATRAFLTHKLSGMNPEYVDTLCYPKQAAEAFMKSLAEGHTSCEGFRYGVSGWGHAKWRYSVNIFGDKLFRFLIYTNCDRKDFRRIGKTCRTIADDLTKAGFPTIVT